MADLKSKAKQTFLGDYNYLVITQDLWEKMQQDERIMCKYRHQGIYVFSEEHTWITSVKKAKKQQVTLGTRATILESMIRSMNRELYKFYKMKPYWELEEVAEG